MRKTTEKSIEINVLRKLVNCLEKKLKKQITVLAPSQRLEHNVGYDELLYGLPDGMVIVFQFKRPTEPRALRPSSTDFVVNVPQMHQLHILFPHGCAFYIFSPFPTHLNLINEYDDILDSSIAVDVHSIAVAARSLTPPLSHRRKFITVRHDGRGLKILNYSHSLNLNPIFPVSVFCSEFYPYKPGINKADLSEMLKNEKNIKLIRKHKLCFLYIADT